MKHALFRRRESQIPVVSWPGAPEDLEALQLLLERDHAAAAQAILCDELSCDGPNYITATRGVSLNSTSFLDYNVAKV